jgi:hypothetical protein
VLLAVSRFFSVAPACTASRSGSGDTDAAVSVADTVRIMVAT